MLTGVGCVLLDLELPDSRGLSGVRALGELNPALAVVVLTGLADEHLGEQAVRAGAQDYLVKGQVDGHLLHRVVRYAVERARAEETQRQLAEARLYAAENARLERGLLPSPVLTDPRLKVTARYRSGGQQMLLGGDFYDVVQAQDGWVHAVVGDVCGRGPDEAALGVCLRVAWRTMVLAGRPVQEVLSAVQDVLEHERQHERLFVTLCMLSIAPDRTSGRLHLAGHPQPVLITASEVTELTSPVSLPPGIRHSTALARRRRSARRVLVGAHVHRRSHRRQDRQRPGAARQRRPDQGHREGEGAGPVRRRSRTTPRASGSSTRSSARPASSMAATSTTTWPSWPSAAMPRPACPVHEHPGAAWRGRGRSQRSAPSAAAATPRARARRPTRPAGSPRPPSRPPRAGR